MIRAVVRSMPKLIGKSRAIVPVTPIPGRTPVSVPTTTPMVQASRFGPVSDTAKPCMS